MKLSCLDGGTRPERASNLALDAPFPSDEINAPGDLEAERVVPGMQDAVEVSKHERVECCGGAVRDSKWPSNQRAEELC